MMNCKFHASNAVRLWGRGCVFKIYVMEKADVEKLIQYSKEHDSKESYMGMDYDTGHSSMVYSCFHYSSELG